jgi:hypothetical protein
MRRVGRMPRRAHSAPGHAAREDTLGKKPLVFLRDLGLSSGSQLRRLRILIGRRLALTAVFHFWSWLTPPRRGSGRRSVFLFLIA